MKVAVKAMAIIGLITCVGGCANLSRTELATLHELKANGISETEVKQKNPGVAGALNILPGFGNFYLASGTDESEQWLYGFLNLLTWPTSVVWGIPEAAIDASTINKKETVNYYTFDKIGKQEFEKIKTQDGTSSK